MKVASTVRRGGKGPPYLKSIESKSMANVKTPSKAVEYVNWALTEHDPDRIRKKRKVGDISDDMQQVVRDCWQAAGWFGDASPYWSSTPSGYVGEESSKILSKEEVLATVTEERARKVLKAIIAVCEEPLNGG